MEDEWDWTGGQDVSTVYGNNMGIDWAMQNPDWVGPTNAYQGGYGSWDDASWNPYSSDYSTGGGFDIGGLLSGAGRFLTSPQGLGTIANLGGGYLNNRSDREAAQIQAQAQIEAARIAADAQKFRPVGVTTSFGQSQFGYDDQGRLSQAGYQLAPGMAQQQDALMGASNNYLNQFLGAQDATAPMAQSAQGMFNLGQQYLGTSPQDQAAKYMADQQALLAPTRATDLANLQATMQAQGRGGLAVGGDAGMAAANPQMQAYYNALQQQDLGLAAQATQGGMDYAKFGGAMMGLGGEMLGNMYGTQQAAFSPYQTALGGASFIEGLGQNAMDIGADLGSTASTAAGRGGALLGQGMLAGANTIGAQAQQAGSTWGNILEGMAPAIQQYRWGT